MRQKISLSRGDFQQVFYEFLFCTLKKLGGGNDPVKQDHCSIRSTQQKHLCSQVKVLIGGLGLLLVLHRAVMEQNQKTK